MLKSYVINLDRDAERLAKFQAHAEASGLPVERVAGVLGADLASAPDVISYFEENGAVSRRVTDALKPGEIGNYASHLRVLQRMLADGAETALIFEDDAMVLPTLPGVIAEVLAKVPPDWDFVRLGNEPKRAYVAIDTLAGGYELVRYSKISNNATANLVNLSGARKFLAPRLRTLASDEDMRRPWRYGLVEYGVIPRPIGIIRSPSTIDALGQRNPRHPLLRRIKPPTDSAAEMVQRLAYNIGHLGARDWLTCLALNIRHTLARHTTKTARHGPPPRLDRRR